MSYRIGINALCADNRSGTGRYATQLLLALARIDHENQYRICAAANSPLIHYLAPYRNFQVYPWRGQGNINRIVFERFVIPQWISAERLDLYHGPAFILPPNGRIPMVVTIHDLIFHLFPHTIPMLKRFYYQREIPRSIHESQRILTDSESTTRDLQNIYGIPRAKISTIALGVTERFFSSASSFNQQKLREKYRLPLQYILSTGTVEPRKNIPRLIEAYLNLLGRLPDGPPLVIAGRIGWKSHVLKPYLGAKTALSRIQFIGYVDDADLPTLYKQAVLYVCASLYEGFGLPVLEAMASGVPVVASNISSLPEVTGSCAALVRPDDAEDIALAMERILRNPSEAQKKSEAGMHRARGFSWGNTAKNTLAAYYAVLQKT